MSFAALSLGAKSFRPLLASPVSAQRVVARSVQAQCQGRKTNVGEYCSIDEGGKMAEKTLGEKESDFIEALQNYYFDGNAKLTDVEFENLKEELIWNGSKVAILSSTEQRFLEATMSYMKGSPILTDDEFDELKAELRVTNSVVTQAGPRCSIRSKRVYADANPAYVKMTLLNVPATLIVLGFIFSIDDLTGFEITKAIELPPPYNIAFLWGLVFPTIYVFASAITSAVLPDNLILTTACPECGTKNQAYFGGIFNVSGNTKTAVVECPDCLSDLEFNSIKREAVIITSSEDKKAALKMKEDAARAKREARERKAKAKAEAVAAEK